MKQVVSILVAGLLIGTRASACSVCVAFGLSNDFNSDHATLADSTSGSDTITRVDRWLQTATDGNTGPRGTPITLTWSVVPDGTRNGGQVSDLVSYLDSQWSVVGGDPNDVSTRPWLVPIQQGLERWGQLAGIDYVFQNNDDGADFNDTNVGVLGQRGDVRIRGIRFGSGLPASVLAFNAFPDGGDMTLDTGENSAYGPSSGAGRFFRNIIAHEHGHGLGLGHLIGTNNLMSPGIGTRFDGPQFHDILVAQRNYGDVLEKDGGNDEFATATDWGALAIGGTLVIGTDAPDLGAASIEIAATQTDFVSIDGSSDVDVFAFTVDGRSQANFTLNPRGPRYNAGPEDTTPMSFNASERSDLTLEIFDANGVRLSRLNTGGLGDSETIAGFKLPEAGTYYARVAGTQDQIQMYSFEVSRAVTPDVANPNVVFRDAFTLADPNQTGVNAFRQSTARQGIGVVDSRYDAGSTDNEDTDVFIEDDTLLLTSIGDGDGGNQAFVDLNRNFLPQLAEQTWSLTFDATLTADAGLGDAWLGLTFNDELPIGLPFSADAELALLLRPTGGVAARQNGGNDTGELNYAGSVVTAETYAFSFVVDESGPEALMSLLINGVSIFTDEVVTLNNIGRYFGLRAHIGGSSPVGLGLDVRIDNILLALTNRNSALLGDFDGDGQVAQGDLNLVLTNWGNSRTFEDGVSVFNTSDVDQEELNPVLTNWGDSLAPIFSNAVPEPTFAIGASLIGLLSFRRHVNRAQFDVSP
ncbi:MAG: matrixin family metalloprotease [Planctomycetota bacterium]